MAVRRYSEEEKSFLHEYVRGHTYKEIAEAFNERFKVNITLRQIKNFVHNNQLNTGFTGRFEKGHIPANKGKKMSPEMYEKAQPTMFKEGSKPANTLPIGTEKLLADGYIWVKVNDKPRVKKSVNWRQKHRIVWEEANGPIPQGHVVTFLDGDRLNCELSNLKLIHKRINMIMNQNELYGEEKEITESGIIVANLIDATKKRKKRKGGGTDG